MNAIIITIRIILIATLLISGCDSMSGGDVVRPEKIVSKREVIYNQETYKTLSDLWQAYYKKFPSEDAYANWMYATRYTHNPDYNDMLNKGLKKYPGNPILLYLAGMTEHGSHNYTTGISQLERAAALDPSYSDPWFGLAVNYMDQNEEEKVDVALKKILDARVIRDEVMDYSYNMLISMAPNSILITNGDNDTYPGWILTRILNIRPDITIVNRNLLNTEWYPSYLIRNGLPNFITEGELKELREGIIAEFKDKQAHIPGGGLFGDTLIVKLIEAATEEKRPVYFSLTLNQTETVKRYVDKWAMLGIISLVTPLEVNYTDELKRVLDIWLHQFRTGGLDSWRLAHTKEDDAGRRLTSNYTLAIIYMRDSLEFHAPEFTRGMAQWYRQHCEHLLHPDMREAVKQQWEILSDIEGPVNRCPIHGTQ